MHSRCEKHLEIVHRNLKYLKAYPVILFQKNRKIEVKAYTDADWDGSISYKKINQWLMYISW